MARPHIILLGLLGILELLAPLLRAAPGPDVTPTPNQQSRSLHLETVLTLVETQHPLLHGSRTEKLEAQGKLLKAMGAFEPTLVNDWELERLVKDGQTKSVGFNDTLIQARHPWGIQGFAGWRTGIGDVEVADLGVQRTNQPLLGIVLPLLRGLGTNPERGELEKSKLAEQEATLNIQQTRQDLYLGAATQFWKWVGSGKIVVLQQEALDVAKARLQQLTRQAAAGAVAEFDVTEAHQEVQRRLENLIKAKREAEQEQFKLSLFTWNNNALLSFDRYSIPEFPIHNASSQQAGGEPETELAQQRRPEILQVSLEAARNNIDLGVAKNNLLPDLRAEAEPTRKPGEFVLGLGYRFGVQLSFPFLQQDATGQKLQLEAKAERLVWLQRYRVQQVALDIDNARSALDRAKERIEAASQSLAYARSLVKGERKRFQMGATNLLFVNLRERNVVEAQIIHIQAQAEYQQAKAFYSWAIGEWTQPAT
ncbi:TolC family protein [Candidatus Nitrospira allomarina]|uniref:TolC family protein n=1 Tax=Candidatus Nitrospira allomarina TaxID=3020900 RepID=A0AA96JSC4_9BACT|nr:TolC family protein [Candidatus Nitrospira allomarina]WNM58108.1 TolC family protein [Candidatus Nitrospira allomarina]